MQTNRNSYGLAKDNSPSVPRKVALFEKMSESVPKTTITDLPLIGNQQVVSNISTKAPLVPRKTWLHRGATIENPPKTEPVVEQQLPSLKPEVEFAEYVKKLQERIENLEKQVADTTRNSEKIKQEEVNKSDESKTQVSMRTTSIESVSDELRDSGGASLDKNFPRAIDLAKHNQRPLWKDIRGIQELGLSDNLDKNARMRQEVKFELMLSEGSFLHGLNILKLHYVANIYKHIQQQILTENDYEVLFKSTLDVRSCSEAFLEDLDKIWLTDPMLNGIYDVIISHATTNFHHYLEYSRNMLDMKNRLIHLTSTKEAFKFLLDVLINREDKKLSLYAFLSSPMQRITRLPLLVKTILEKLDKGCEEYTKCAAAYDAVCKIASECDAVVTEKKQIAEIIEVTKDLEFGEFVPRMPIAIPGRAFINVAHVKYYVFRYSYPDRDKLELLLFSDLLLICKKKSDKPRVVIKHCPKDAVNLEELDDPTFYAENSKQVKPCLLKISNGKRKINLIVTFNDKILCSEWLRIFAEPDQKPILKQVQYLALYPFEPQNEDELEFQKGEVIDNVTKMENGWWKGCIGDRTGLFPASYVQEINSEGLIELEPEQEQCRVLFSFHAKNEKDLTIHKDQIVTIIEKNDIDWWTGEVNGKTGLFPSNYVEIIKNF